ncbi:hypothetical protein JAAARDRAFT_197939 [Jaapia argillacea MUCL 33604]|uniref:Uncharacterized protein n=1 Tax=Jaapia argillacea MUCL 33604 TaxID=933084 RepID=A0A067PGA1_9AGAM|nr:hypothetical protein JAAARDRAFT_197939 [Jaapia argillacea MUCL 33604]
MATSSEETSALILQPFGETGTTQERVDDNAARLCSALATLKALIPGAQNSSPTISPPLRDPDASRFSNSFMAHGLTPAMVQFLLSKVILSLPVITFKVLPLLNMSNPYLLFPITEIDTTAEVIKKIICDTWSQPLVTQFILDGLQITDPMACLETMEGILMSIEVERVKNRMREGFDRLRYNVFARLGDTPVWADIRDHLWDIPYVNLLHRTAHSTPFKLCSLCHCMTHPRGLCPFPSLPGWNGPLHNPTPPGNAQVGPPCNKGGQDHGMKNSRGWAQGRR